MVKSEYDGMTVFLHGLCVGADGVIIFKDDFKYVKVEQVVRRSDDVDKYDKAECCEELARSGLEWDISAEFIEDNDCYYVFMREI